jgi:asparaginyl-tRNA synthetase
LGGSPSAELAKTHNVSEVFALADGTKARLAGWVASKSEVGGVLFLQLRDGTGFLQLVARKPGKAYEEALSASKEEAVVAEGVVRSDPRAPGGKELLLTSLEVVARADAWPITPSIVKSPKAYFDLRHLTIRGRKAQALAKVRAELFRLAFEFFSSRGFTYITAPLIVQAAVEGGATLFKLDYFGREAYLSQSAQFYEEAAICSLEKVFVIQPAFRAEKSRTPKHLTEFWMIEAEMAFADQEDNMRLQEEFVSYLAGKIKESCARQLETLGRDFTPPRPPFPRLTYDSARELAAEKGFGFPWGEDITTEAERSLSSSFDVPFFITDYPLSARSFYHMTRPDRPDVTLSADLMAPEGYGEIATGGQRIHDYETLKRRIEALDLPASSFQWYLELRRYGMPPHSGFGIGVERLLRWICGIRNIRYVTLFPRTPARVYP